mgnify:CR=1 FL=1
MRKQDRTALVLMAGLSLLITACGKTQTQSQTQTQPPASTSIDSTEPSSQEAETVEYEGEYYLKSEISEDTLKWLERYHQMPEEDRLKINMVPPEFVPKGTDIAAMETNETKTVETQGTGEPLAVPDILLTSAPEIVLTDPLSSALNEFRLQSGNYSWSVMENKEVQEVVACGAHPLDQVMEKMKRLKVPSYNRLDAIPYSVSCIIPPDKITVTAWDISNLGDTESKEESVTVYENKTLIELQPGKVYELTAEWSRDQLETRSFSGTASYTILTE